MTWKEEWDKIKAAGARWGLSPHFIAAIRKQENGRDGCEFGVLGVSAPTYDDQLRACCASVKHRLLEYDINNQALSAYMAPNGDNVIVYSGVFIDYFASIWAPGRAWSNGVKWWYAHLLDAEHQVGAERQAPTALRVES